MSNLEHLQNFTLNTILTNNFGASKFFIETGIYPVSMYGYYFKIRN